MTREISGSGGSVSTGVGSSVGTGAGVSSVGWGPQAASIRLSTTTSDRASQSVRRNILLLLEGFRICGVAGSGPWNMKREKGLSVLGTSYLLSSSSRWLVEEGLEC